MTAKHTTHVNITGNILLRARSQPGTQEPILRTQSSGTGKTNRWALEARAPLLGCGMGQGGHKGASWLAVGGDRRVYVYLNKSLCYTLRMSVLHVCHSAIRKVKGVCVGGELIKGLLRF